MNLVDKIMDIPCQQSLPDDAPEVAHTAYKLGHREGCWAAVLAAKEFQSQYSMLYEALELTFQALVWEPRCQDEKYLGNPSRVKDALDAAMAALAAAK